MDVWVWRHGLTVHASTPPGNLWSVLLLQSPSLFLSCDSIFKHSSSIYSGSLSYPLGPTTHGTLMLLKSKLQFSFSEVCACCFLWRLDKLMVEVHENPLSQHTKVLITGTLSRKLNTVKNISVAYCWANFFFFFLRFLSSFNLLEGWLWDFRCYHVLLCTRWCLPQDVYF